jgi:5S rRNA maturation endonuclease (ribonuclease M5)
MTLGDNSAEELAARLMISPYAVREAVRRGFVGFKKRRGVACWRFGDKRNGCLRRLDGQPFRINGKRVKAEAETHGDAWHQLIGLDDVFENDRGEILLTPEGSKDALAALHLADAEDTLRRVGVVAALGSAVKPTAEDIEKLRGRRIQIFPDVDDAGQNAAERIGQAIATLAAEVQVFDLARLYRDDGERVKDLFDVTRIDYDDFEANRGLWSLTDLDRKGERVKTIPTRICFSDFSNIIPSKSLSSPPSSPHVSPESHGFPVYPVSSSQELEKELEELAEGNACTERDTARKRRWKIVCDLTAVEKGISRKLTADELMRTFDKWYKASAPYLDPEKSRDNYLAAFLAELGKVRVPTGEGESLKKALERVSALPITDLPEIPGMPEAHESWRRVVALHRELARGSANGIYFLSCRDAAKAHHCLNKDSAWNINHALASRLGVISFMRVGDVRPGGKASEFRYLLPL